MLNKKPHIVVFFGGDSTNNDLSRETGYWACQYIPRSAYQVTPVHIRADGKWQVPLGSLPQQGPVDRMMSMLFKSLRALSPKEGLQRLLSRPINAFLSVMRGRGGDDGTMYTLGRSLDIPVAGSSAAACVQTADKHIFTSRVKNSLVIPSTLHFPASLPTAQITDSIREQFVPPLFIKPATQEGSAGIEEITTLDDLASAVKRTQSLGDILAQEKALGTELTVTLVQDKYGKLITLPPTVVVPYQTTYYDSISKRRPGRVKFHTPDRDSTKIVTEAEQIARDIFSELGLRGYASVDMVADGDTIRLLEVNSVPTLTSATPLQTQLTAAGLHPGSFFDNVIAQALREGW